MKTTFKGLIKLIRFDEYVLMVIINTLLGVAAAKGTMNWRFFILIPANWLAVGFYFMINNIKNAPDDALSTYMIYLNPISIGLITPKAARIASCLIAMMSMGLFGMLGLWPGIFGMITLILGYLHACQRILLRNSAFTDLLIHSLVFAGMQFLAGYRTFASNFSDSWFWPFIFVLSISMYGKLFADIQHVDSDRSERAGHRVNFLRKRAAHVLMTILLLISVFSGVASLILVDWIPLWVLILMTILAGLFILLSIFKMKETPGITMVQTMIHKPLEHAAALALVLQYLIPWIGQF